MRPENVQASEVIKGVTAFNSRYREMEAALFCLANAAAKDLLRGVSSTLSEELVWTIKSWWGIQGVRRDVKRIAAEALLALEWRSEFFAADVDSLAGGEPFALRAVKSFVREMRRLGAQRREWSLAAKTLHWLLPWRIPVYDSFVKSALGLSTDMEPAKAYSEIVHWEYDAARRLLAKGKEWFGDVEPKSPFRALDKYLWWDGGGDSGTAAAVRNPWRVIRNLGLECP